MAWSLLLALRFVLVLQGVHALLPLSAGVHRAVDRLLLHRAGGHRRQLFGVLHHPLHGRSLCLPHLPHLHLRGSREAESPARDLPCAHAQQARLPHHLLVGFFPPKTPLPLGRSSGLRLHRLSLTPVSASLLPAVSVRHRPIPATKPCVSGRATRSTCLASPGKTSR